MQRFVAIRFAQAILALWAVSVLVFGLARISGNPLDALLSFEAGPEQKALIKEYWGLDKSLLEQYFTFIETRLRATSASPSGSGVRSWT